ncbi:MAG TPA: rhodanese-like domain-containing protein, partial [Pyrinomonadaceae bacterium]|nr:rhodanese-like domain-containing protein [Pyrinomonadaceae bacterium]
GARLPRALVEEYENEILGPARERAERLCDEAFARSRLYADLEMLPSARKQMFDDVVRQFDGEVRAELLNLLKIDGPGGFHLRRALGHAAGWLNELAGRYREEGWPEQAVYLYREALALAAPGTDAPAEAEAALRELDAGAEPDARTEETFAAGIARALSPRRPSPKLFADGAAPARKDETFRGCLMQIAFYVLVVAACFGLNECGVINTRRSTPPPGLSNYNFRVPVPQFTPVPFPSLAPYSSVPTLTAAELRQRMRRGQVLVVDARGRDEYEAGHIAGALSVPHDEAEGQAPALLRRGRQVVCYGSAARPWSAQIVALALRIEGLKSVAVLEGGFEAWVAEGLPTEAETPAPPATVERAAPPAGASPPPTARKP